MVQIEVISRNLSVIAKFVAVLTAIADLLIMTGVAGSGAWLLKATNPSNPVEDGQVMAKSVWLPCGTFVRLPGSDVEFKINFDGLEFYLYQGKYKGITARGMDYLKGDGVEVNIMDYYFLGSPATSASVFVDIKADSATGLQLSKPIVRPRLLRVAKDGTETTLRSVDPSADLGSVSIDTNITPSSAMFYSSTVDVRTQVNSGKAEVQFRIVWDDQRPESTTLLADGEATGVATSTVPGNVLAIQFKREGYIAKSSTIYMFWNGEPILSRTLTFPNVKSSTGVPYIDTTTTMIESATKKYRAWTEGQVKNAIESYNRDYVIPHYEQMKKYIVSLRDNTQQALKNMADKFDTRIKQLDEKVRIIEQGLSKPHLTVYAPLNFISGLPNKAFFETTNAEIVKVKVVDGSGTLLEAPMPTATFTPNSSGSGVHIEVTYRGLYGPYAGKEYTWVPDSDYTLTFREGWWRDNNNNPGASSESPFVGFNALDLILIISIVGGGIAFFLWRRSKIG